MRQPMSTRERLLVALIACLALVIVPMTALAATGQLINIVDGSNAARSAKVSSAGALLVETRPGVRTNTFHRGFVRTGTGWSLLYQLDPGTQAVAFVELSLSNMTTAGTKSIEIAVWDLPTAGSCGTATTAVGKVRLQQRFVVVKSETTLQLQFGAVPIYMGPVPAGRKHCFGINIGGPTTGTLYSGITGYTYTP